MALGPPDRASEYFDTLETMSPAERRQYQDRRLASTVALAYRKAPAARAILERAGLRPRDVRAVTDLEKLPITRKTELIEMQKSDPPYGGFLSIAPEAIERVFISPGPLYEPLQPSFIKWFAKAFWAAGFRRGDVVINAFTYHMSPAGILMHESLRDCGATVVPMGTGNTDIQVQTIRDLKVTGFVGTPSFLMALLKRAEELGIGQRGLSLRKAWFTGEMLAPSVRRTLEEVHALATSQAYAVTEPGGAIAYECRHKFGMHLMDEYVVEIVDPRTGKQLGPGEQGEIVVTPIHNRTWGLLRFGTGDISSLTAGTCPCGRTADRLGALVGRTGDAVKVRGMFIVGKQVEQLLAGFRQVGRFQIAVGRTGQRDEMTLRLEALAEVSDKESLAAEINQRFQDLCRLRLDRIEFVAKGTLQADLKTLVDERKWD